MRPHLNLNKRWCCPLSFAIENCHIFRQGQCENTFNMSAALHMEDGTGKVTKNILLRTTLCGILHYKFGSFTGQETFPRHRAGVRRTKKGRRWSPPRALRPFRAASYLATRRFCFGTLENFAGECSPTYFAMASNTSMSSWHSISSPSTFLYFSTM